MIDKLEFLLALAREQHFGRAAATCGVSQPTLSAGVKQLEETLGVLLVQRGARFQAFTPEGQRVLDWARRIVADERAMRDEVRGLRAGLTGHLRLAAVPTALPAVARLTTPVRARHPGIGFRVLSRTSTEILALLDNLEIDAGLTYLDQEPVGRVRAVPMFRERYCLVLSAEDPLAQRAQIGWEEVGLVPLCLLTPNMQGRRIIDRQLRAAGHEARPMLVSDSVLVLLTHVRTGQWASIMAAELATAFDLPDTVRAVPIAESAISPTIGLIYPFREPTTPLVAALVTEARRSVSPA